MSAENKTPKSEKQFIACLTIGALLILAGLGVQGYLAEQFTLDKDFDLEFESVGTTTFVNNEYLYAYSFHYRTKGVNEITNSYTTVKTTTIKGIGENNRFVTYNYQTTIQQPRFMIDKDGGSYMGDDILSNETIGGSPDEPFMFKPHRPANTLMILDKKDWNYYSPLYEQRGLLAKTGYARSVFTHHLEKKSYPIWIGSLSRTVDSWFIAEKSVNGIDGYEYGYTYSLESVLARDALDNPVSTLVMTEKTIEVHEPDLGILLQMSTNLNYTIEIAAGPQPIVIPLYSESSMFEIDDDDKDDISTALYMETATRIISYVLPVAGLVVVGVGFVKGRRKKTKS